MDTKTKDNGNFAAIESVKELRARDAALAMREYQDEKLAVQARMEQLRALRLSQTNSVRSESEPQPDAIQKKTATKKPPREG
ncbi:hypothetical protein [Leptospira sp. severe_002]|uniref:hypothetical protein n=1 Tax=Leptospira sp. severe_002 TaxID=2838237 RepID=UPI001E2A2E89|nr:hypothetical protein [Leptospira sp. severe_002]